MSKQLRELPVGVRVYIPLWGDNRLYEVKGDITPGWPDITIVRENDNKSFLVPPQMQAVIYEEDDGKQEHCEGCGCNTCLDRWYMAFREEERRQV